MKDHPKVLLVSQTLPPAVGGSPILLNNLFSQFNGEVLGISGYTGSAMDSKFQPEFPTVYFNPPSWPLIGKYARRYHNRLVRYFHGFITRGIINEARKFKPDIIFAACPNIDYFVCAYRAAKKLNIPFYAHMHDLWLENHGPETYIGKMARKWEEKILKSSDRVLCMTQVQAEHYNEKYGIKTETLPHTIPDSQLDPANLKFKDDYNNTVIFTGAISRVMNEDAIRVLSQASEGISEFADILLCTSSTETHFDRKGIDSKLWDIRWVSRDEVKDLQEKSAVLFAPLSMKNGGMDEIRTVFSTKLLEYLVSGRPILIFAPEDSFHSRSATNGGWAHVVNDDDPDILMAEIKKLMSDEELQKKIVQNAFEEAKSRRASIVAAKLSDLIRNDMMLV